MRTSHSLVLAAGAVLVMTTSACSLSPAHSAAEDLTEHFTTAYPDHVLEAQTTAADQLPFVPGDLVATLVLADDTPPEALTEILGELVAWEPGNGATYQPIGVVANGVGICVDDPQQDAKVALRDQLYAEGLALEGTWGCSSGFVVTEPQYAGALDVLLRDTELVGPLLTGDAAELRLLASVDTPYGSIDHPWASLPETLAPTLDAVAAEHPLQIFALTDEGLQIAVRPTSETSGLLEVAEAVAGPDLPVQIMQGSLDPDRSTGFAERAHLADALGAVAGVDAVRLDPQSYVSVTTSDLGAVRDIYDAAMELPEFRETETLRITVAAPGPDGTSLRHDYSHPPGADEAHLDLFGALVEHEVVTRVSLSDPGPEGARLTLSVTDTLPSSLPQVKGLLPDGLQVTAQGADWREVVDFTTARTLEANDIVTNRTIPDLEAIARAWNDAD